MRFDHASLYAHTLASILEDSVDEPNFDLARDNWSEIRPWSGPWPMLLVAWNRSSLWPILFTRGLHSNSADASAFIYINGVMPRLWMVKSFVRRSKNYRISRTLVTLNRESIRHCDLSCQARRRHVSQAQSSVRFSVFGEDISFQDDHYMARRWTSGNDNLRTAPNQSNTSKVVEEIIQL